MDGRAYVYIMFTIFSQYFGNKFYVTGCYWWKKKCDFNCRFKL